MQISRLIKHRGSLTTLPPVLLLIIGFAVFHNSLDNTLVFDDAVWLESGDIHHLDQPLRWMTTGSEGPAHGRPVAAFTLAANFAWGARTPIGYHIVNLAIHLACGLVLYGVVRRSLRRPPLASDYSSTATGLSFAVALLWLVHPLQTECVNYISQRTTSLAGLCYLLAFYFAIRGDRSSRPALWSLLATASCWVGVGCKEIIVTAPFMVVLYDICYRYERITQVWRRRWTLYVGLASSWAPLALLLALHPRERTVGGYLDITPLRYAMNQCVVLIEYVQLVFWPRKLSIDYGIPVPLTWMEIAPSAGLLLLLLFGTVFLLFRKPAVGFLGAWFFVILAPTSSFLPIVTEVGAERRVYLSLAAPLAFFVIRGWAWLEHLVCVSHTARWRNSASSTPFARTLARSLGIAILIVVTLLLGVRTRRRNEDYRSNLSLWFSALTSRPDNPRAHYNFAVQLSNCGADADAVAIYQRLLKRWPKHANALNNMGAHYDEQREYAKAIAHYQQAMAAAPDWHLPLRNLVVLLSSCRDPQFRDGPRARRLGRFLCNVVDDRRATSFDALAAAYAECGEFENAQRIAKIGIARALDACDETFAKEVEGRWRLYGVGKPYRSQGPLSEDRRRARQMQAVAGRDNA